MPTLEAHLLVDIAELPPVYFSRRPYNVTYYKDGEQKTIRRMPPPVLHKMLPTDVVSLNRSKNEDFSEGDEFSIKHINTRQPNTIQIMDDDGVATFVSHADLNLEEAVAPRRGVSPKDHPRSNRYLLWP